MTICIYLFFDKDVLLTRYLHWNLLDKYFHIFKKVQLFYWSENTTIKKRPTWTIFQHGTIRYTIIIYMKSHYSYQAEPWGSHGPRQTQQNSALQFWFRQTMWLQPPSFSMVTWHFGHSCQGRRVVVTTYVNATDYGYRLLAKSQSGQVSILNLNLPADFRLCVGYIHIKHVHVPSFCFFASYIWLKTTVVTLLNGKEAKHHFKE